eukprot:4281943-Alexandrium_andersonii.AAC.1
MLRKSPAAEPPSGRPRRSIKGRAISSSSSRSRSRSTKCAAERTSNLTHSSATVSYTHLTLPTICSV